MTEKSEIKFIMNSSPYTLPLSRAIIQKIPDDKDDVYNQLISNHPYQVQSSVPNEIFQSFLNYWKTGTIPQINSSNILYYNSLNDEFGILENQLSLPEYQSLFDLGYLINMDQNKNMNKASVERRIALNLEFYLADQAEILCQVPINSLYNIFYHPERNLTDYDRAYHFIIDKGRNLNEIFFILLGSLDARRFKQLENKRDAFFGREDHRGFEPQNANNFFSDIEQQLQDCRNQINQHMASNQQNQQLEADLKNANQRNQQLEADLQNANRRNQQLEADLQNANQRNQQLEADLKNANQRNQQLEADLKNANQQIQKLKTSLKNANHQIQNEIDIQRFKECRVISKGSFGNVYNVKDKETGKSYVAKTIDSQDKLKKHNELIQRELEIMSSIKHPTIIRFIGYSSIDFHNNNKPTIIMEYAANGSLANVLRDIKLGRLTQRYTNTTRQIIISGIACGMKYLHERGIIHRDLKPGNILLNENFYPLITDYGFSKFNDTDLNSIIKYSSITKYSNDLIYTAPEILNEDQYDNKIDVYAFAMIMYQVISDTDPYPELYYDKTSPNRFMNRVMDDYRPEFNFPIKESLKNLIIQCWSSDPNKRPTFTEIFNELTGSVQNPKNDDYVLEGVDMDELKDYVDGISEKNYSAGKLAYDMTNDEKDDDDSQEKISTIETKNEKLRKDNINSEELIDNFDTKYYEQAAKLGNSGVMADLSNFYANGYGVEKDYSKAKEYYEQAVKLKHNEKNTELYQLITSKVSQNLIKNMKNLELIKQEDLYELFKAEEENTKEIFTAKIFYQNINDYPKEIKTKILDNLFIMTQISHPSIEKCFEFNDDGIDKERSLTLLTEYIPPLTLKEVIEEKQTMMNDTQKLINIYGIAAGMSYLHSQNILHYDLNPTNILEDDHFYPKIINYGMRVIFNGLKSMAKIHDTSKYYAPEYYEKNEYKKSSDVYSFSLIVYEIVTNKNPFETLNFIDHLQNIHDVKRPTLNNEIPKPYRLLIEKCWSENPDDRPTFEFIVKELKENPQFITEKVDVKKYREYIKLIESSNLIPIPKLEFDEGKKIIDAGGQGKKDKKKSSNDKQEENVKKAKNERKEKEKNGNEQKQKDDKEQGQSLDDDKSDENENDNEKDEEEYEEEEEEEEYEEEEEEEEDDDDDESKSEEEENELKLQIDDIKELPYLIPSVKNINLNKYEVHKDDQLGRGFFSYVYKAYKIGLSFIPFASKHFLMDAYERRKNLLPIQNLTHEVYNHSILSHPSIVKFVGYSPVNFENKRYQPVLMMKFIRNGSLGSIIEKVRTNKSPKKWNDTKKLINIFGIASAMSYIHSLGILHRDLSIYNVLVDRNFYPKLCDFGLSINLKDIEEEEKDDVMGTTEFIAPEIWMNYKYSKSSDVYAFGFIVYILITNKIPYSGMFEFDIIRKVCKQNLRPTIPKNVPTCYRNLIESCWNQNQDQRPTFDFIVNELKTNNDFVKEIINKPEFQKYIRFIEDSINTPINQPQQK